MYSLCCHHSMESIKNSVYNDGLGSLEWYVFHIVLVESRLGLGSLLVAKSFSITASENVGRQLWKLQHFGYDHCRISFNFVSILRLYRVYVHLCYMFLLTLCSVQEPSIVRVKGPCFSVKIKPLPQRPITYHYDKTHSVSWWNLSFRYNLNYVSFSTFLYMKFLMVWAVVLMADFILEFRFEYLWPFWLLVRSVYDSFKFQGLVRVVFLVYWQWDWVNKFCKIKVKIGLQNGVWYMLSKYWLPVML